MMQLSSASPSSHPDPFSSGRQSLLLATHNSGKVQELRQLLQGLDLTLYDLSQWPHLPTVEETGTSFSENALLKARYYHRHTGLVTLADDSGLEVYALGGAPGVDSARYAGQYATDAQRIAKLLDALRDVPDTQRGARFVCVVALVGPNQLEKTFTGVCLGRITHVPRGDGGFGYDPVFEYPPLAKTFAQLSREEKSAVSHRGHAMRQLRQFLMEWLANPG